MKTEQVTIPECGVTRTNRLVIHRNDAWAATQFGLLRDNSIKTVREFNKKKDGSTMVRGDAAEWFIYELHVIDSQDVVDRLVDYLAQAKSPWRGDGLRYRFV